MARNDLICWLDLETTGRDPCSDRILEIGMILTDYDLKEVGEFHRVLRHTNAIRDPVVQVMHRNSGLLDECKQGMPAREAFADALDWLVGYADPESAPSAGFTVGFDRSFLAVHAWAIHEWLSHRSIDCSTLKILRKAWAPDVTEPAKGSVHRAIPDCREAIRYLAAMRGWLTPNGHGVR